MAAKKKRQPPYCSTLEISQWHERDRNHVSAQTPGGKSVGDWWDEDVHSMVEDGFFKVSGPFGRGGVDPSSVKEYLASVGACREGTPGSIFGRLRRRR